MKVAELQSFVKTLVQPLSSVGVSKTVCGNLESVAAGLELFRDLTIAQFADFLAKAEEYQRTGVLSAPAKSARVKKAKPSPISVPEAVQRVRDMYERATDPTLTYPAIDAEIDKLEVLSKDGILAVAKEMGFTLSTKNKKTKKAVRDEIKRRIVDRKASFERVQSGRDWGTPVS